MTLDVDRHYIGSVTATTHQEKGIITLESNPSRGTVLPAPCITNSYEKESLSYSQRMSVITLLFKKGDKNLLGNYRPISLTNTDYKIVAFIFAKRLQKVLDSIISQNQSAYVKGRFIGINARLIIDIFEYCENLGEESILLFLDFHKAFDSVEWSFLFETLKRFNFGDHFIK